MGRLLALCVVGLAFLATGCAETQFLAHTAKQVRGQSGEAPTGEGGRYKVGSPYQISGVWYYPKEDYDYVETGIASWYGPQFHQRNTANGEVFDMNKISAAHRTLPLPSIVQVTNLENGRSLRLRVNDRGPFAHGRILDVSRRGAQLLGFHRQGTARVRVEILADESRALAARMQGQQVIAREGSPIKVDKLPKPDVDQETAALAPPPGARAAPPPVQAAEAPPPVAAPPQPVQAQPVQPAAAAPSVDGTVRVVPVGPTNLYIQAGAFSEY
ncbi:MAG: septal ring lytic transglycosylase RlpA family protein, partial [Rhodobacterales bacterium]|nr:septal ring lytic transglycosylase RlpA family protein [Rhodobacterales bacterium]